MVITSAIFPSYFLSLQITGWQTSNSVLYAYMYSLASLFIMVLSPVFGAMADHTGRKKVFMKFFSFTGAVSCGLLYFSTADHFSFIGALFIVSSVCYSLGAVFYNAYIPQIAAPEQYDTVSAKGFAWGYIGGMIALAISLLIIQFAAPIGFSASQIQANVPVRVSFIFIGVWWMLFAAYSFKGLPADKKTQALSIGVLVQSYTHIIHAFRRTIKHKAIFLFLVAFFFYDMGVTTIMGMSSVFATQTLHLTTSHLIGVILLLQLLAVAGSYAFVVIAKKFTNLTAVKSAVVLWIIVCFIGYAVQNIAQFYCMAGLVGLVMGGTQAMSRSAFATLIQDEQHEYATWFSLYDVLDKIGVTIGTFLFGWIEYATGSMRHSVAMLSLYFIIGFIFLQLTHKAWKR